MGDDNVMIGSREVTLGRPHADGRFDVPLGDVLPDCVDALVAGVPDGWPCVVAWPAPAAVGVAARLAARPDDGDAEALLGVLADERSHRDALDGTMTLSPEELGAIGVDPAPGGRLVVIGDGDHIEIWAADRWAETARLTGDEIGRLL